MTIKEKDDLGNYLLKEDNSIKLYLKKESKTKIIGFYDEKTNIYRKNVKIKNIFQKTNSIGFCYKLLTLLPKNCRIIINIIESKTEYHINLKNAMLKGSFLFFKEKGFEKQLFVPLYNFRKRNIK
jgi:hypothetical protein